MRTTFSKIAILSRSGKIHREAVRTKKTQALSLANFEKVVRSDAYNLSVDARISRRKIF